MRISLSTLPHSPARACSRQGFSLLELTVVMLIIGLIASMGMTIGEPMVENAKMANTQRKLDAIESALAAYRTSNNRLPCPADVSIVSTANANYGAEAANPGACTGGSPAANFNDTTNKVVEGGVPTAALGLPADMQYDGWGRKFAYSVWTKFTQADAFTTYSYSSTTCGKIIVKDAAAANITNRGIYTLVSFGPDGHGAYTEAGVRLNAGVTNAQSLINCHCDSSAAATAYANTYVQKNYTPDPSNAANNFDDLVRYKERWQMQTAEDGVSNGQSCNNGIYYPGWGAGGWGGQQAAMGDFNGDGIKDIAFNVSAAHILIFYGVKGGWDSGLTNVPVQGLDGMSWWIHEIKSGDLNGDGIDDLIVGHSRGRYVYGAGSVYVLYGKNGGMDPLNTWIDVPTYIAAGNGFILDGTVASEQMGDQVAVGDINGDGKNDLILGTLANSGFWYVNTLYILYGPGGWPTQITVDDAYLNGGGTALNGFKFNGSYLSSTDYHKVNLVTGDINGDGKDDIVSGAFFASNNGLSRNGSLYVLFGKPTAARSSVNITVDETFLAGGGTAVNGFRYDGTTSNWESFKSVAVGDINKDGYDDIFTSSVGEAPISNGNSTIIYGKASGFNTTQTLDDSNGNWFFYGWYATPWITVLGDINNDGNLDMISQYNSIHIGYQGYIYMRYGTGTTMNGWFTHDDGTLNGGGNGLNGTRFDGGTNYDGLGCDNILVGDVTGDGLNDILMGCMYEGSSDEGAIRVVYGRKGAAPFYVPTNVNSLLNE